MALLCIFMIHPESNSCQWFGITLMQFRCIILINFSIFTFASGLNQISESDLNSFKLDSVYYQYQVIYADTSPYDSLFTPVLIDTMQQETEGLRISGAKDFSFDMDQGFDQGLKVDIAGEMEGVKVEGNLSDKATPSSTVQISDVEKMSFKVSTKNFYGGLGNLSLDLPFGVQDEIQGARIGIHSLDKESALGVSYAVNRGAVKRLRFSGEEGKQSPYFLEGNVIAGSEKVYLAQGIEPPVLLKRDEDYGIDYERGIISFTNNNIITNHSRIEVEYQQALEDYPNIYGEGDSRMKIGNIVFTGMYRRRYDEKENPMTFTMSQVEIESLKIAGDSATVLHTYADTSSEGNYIIQDDHFVYAGEGNGDYIVTFFYVGEDNGKYIYDPSIKAFSYQGPGSGNYSPTKFIPLPSKDEFYGIGMYAFESLRLDVYGSYLDKNTFSPIDDYDNSGTGYRANLNKKLNIFTINGEYIYYHERFFKPFGDEIIDYQYQWNTTDSLQEMGQVALGVTPTTFLQVEVGYGILNREHKRKLLRLRPFFFYFGYENVDSIDKYLAGFRKKQGKFLLNSQYENCEKSHLFNYGINYLLTENTTIGISGSYDKDTTNRGITTVFNILTSPLSLSLGHRLYNDTTFLFGNAMINIRYKGAALIGNLQQSQRYSQKRDETYVKVEEGHGNYVYDPVTDVYIEKEGGDYIKKVFLLQEFERVVSRNYTIEAGYTKSIYDLKGRFYYADEKDFMSNSNDILFAINEETHDFEFNIRQDITEDARYALYKTSNRDRLFSFTPSYKALSVRAEIEERIEKYNERIREKKNSYGGDIAYRIIPTPLIRPKVGYKYSKIFSDYFENLDIRLHTPKTSLLFGIPIKTKGRIELTGELIYRMYNIKDIPYFFTATEPAGLSKIFWVTASFGVGNNTIFSLIYKIEFPPEEKFRQNLRCQTKIRF